MKDKLTVDYASDLHIPFWVSGQGKARKRAICKFIEGMVPKEGERADVLILAGDLGEGLQDFIDVVEASSAHYERVIVTMGNHDYYLISNAQMRTYEDSLKKEEALRDYFKETPGVIFAVNETITLFDKFTIGVSPLWYEITSQVEDYKYMAQSNDYRYVVTSTYDNWRELRERDLTYYNSIGEDELDLMVSHIPPLDIPGNPYPHSDSFVSEVSELKAKDWICGHQHTPAEFTKAGTTFHVNPIGYPGEIYNEGGALPAFKQITISK